MHTTPPSLLDRLRLPGQEQAWERFVGLYTPLLLCWARRLGLDAEDAADLVQDVFATLVRKLPELAYDPGRRFRGWLWTVLKNKWKDRKRRHGPPRPAGEAELAGLADPDDLEALWEAEHNQRLARRALELMRREFEDTTWRAFQEFVMAGRPAAQVAAELGLTENAVYIAKCRVVRRLRQELAGLID
jgi:RNA polymerase sigma-70 factor (ECF subfamily)